MTTNTNIILPNGFALPNPEAHAESVRLFHSHFEIQPARPSPTLLRYILTAFSNLPYENLSKIIKLSHLGENQEERLRLPQEIIEDHLQYRLGGTCFSLAFFLESILLHYGFICYPIMADMRAGRNIHCALIVFLDGQKHLVDPGYLLREPMALDPDRPRIYHSEFTGVELRFDQAAEHYDLFTFNRQEVKWRYRFVDRPTPMDEFVQHWQASFHRNSMHGLCLTRSKGNKLVFVHKRFMRITSPEGKRNVRLKHNYHQTIHEIFGIAPEYIEQALAALDENMARERQLPPK